ncbi:hypothetical protein ACO0SA_003116 [Hanseniaspora valbyensis]
MEDTSKLNTSKLGTQKYWDDFYDKEINNFKQDKNDLGERWFDDSDAEMKMIEFIMDEACETDTEIVFKNDQTGLSNFIDLGTGNGHLLFELINSCDFLELFIENSRVTGCDYSSKSIEFANDIKNTKFADFEFFQKNVEFKVMDIFDDETIFKKYEVVTDKGTLDAIALSGLSKYNKAADKEISLVDYYPYVIEKLLSKKGLFVITSCNFTQEELIKIIESSGNLIYYKHVNYPSIEFGGIKGTTICTVAFTTK